MSMSLMAPWCSLSHYPSRGRPTQAVIVDGLR